MSQAQATKHPTLADVIEWHKEITPPESVTELRILNAQFDNWKRPATYAGFFDDVAAMTRAMAKATDKWGPLCNVYSTLNPVSPALLARAANRVEYAGKKFSTTTDGDIVRRTRILIDVDPTRPAGVSATIDERQKAAEVCRNVRDFLAAKGFASPVVADSGNGWHLHYRVDLPNDDESRDLVKALLEALHVKFSTADAVVDTSVFNASRICKFYGSKTKKGDSVAAVGRVHRMSRAMEIPGDWHTNVVSTAHLQTVVAESGEHSQKLADRPTQATRSDREELLRVATSYIAKADPANNGERNNKAYNIAGNLAAFQHESGARLEELEIQDLMSGWNSRNGTPLDDRELRATVSSALRNGTPREPKIIEASRKPKSRTATESSETKNLEYEKAKKQLRFRPGVANYVELPGEDEGDRPTIVPVDIQTIGQQITEKSNGWPKRVGTLLFEHTTHDVRYLENVDSFIAWLGRVTEFPPAFRRGEQLHTKAEVFQHLSTMAEAFDAIENIPHEPRLKSRYYAHKPIEPGEGTRLRELLDRFCPATTIDRDLILAMFATVMWGGPDGARPAFVITAAAGTGAMGTGKSTLARVAARLFGGCIDVSASEKIDQIKQRLLTPESLTKRIVVLDNIKKSVFSFAELEALITSGTISGKRMYHGEAGRPNTLTCILTLNGVSLSADLAQRCVVIKLGKPSHSGGWEEETNRLIDDHREDIFADLIAFLREERGSISGHSRWGQWERDVLARLPEPADAQKVIQERRGEVDAEDDDAAEIEECIALALVDLGYDTDHEKVFLPTRVLARLWPQMFGETRPPKSISRHLRILIEKGKLERIRDDKSNNRGARGFMYWGDSAREGESSLNDIEHRIEQRERLGSRG